MQNVYQRELQALKPYDEVQGVEDVQGYQFINTAGHGYLVVPSNDPKSEQARELCNYGFKGRHATYLEEDCEAPAFLGL